MVFHLKVIMPGLLTVELAGGLGNQMFQLAALMSISKRTKHTPYIQSLANPSPHTSVSYFDTLFQSYKTLHSTIRPRTRMTEKDSLRLQWSNPIIGSPIELRGYFQDWRYIDPEFILTLRFPQDMRTKYSGTETAIFLHIRGGDYVGNAYHDVGLDAYYTRAIALFPNAHFFLVTNDLKYALSKSFIQEIQYTVIDEPELETLYLMSQCAGGICANSSFSWWGAFLNPHRKIIMPDRWYPTSTMNTEGYYFPGVIKCPV